MPFTGPVEDRNAIREFYDSYADGAARMNRADWLACYAHDASWKSHYFDLTGIEAIAAKYDEIMHGVTDTTFFIQIGSIEVTGDTAHTRAFCAESLLQPNGSTYDLTGEYHDELVRRDGHWHFLRRDYLVKREKAPE